MNTTAGEVRASVLLRAIPWLLFAAGFCVIIVGGIAAGLGAYDIGLVIGSAMLMLLPVNIIAFLISRYINHRLLASACGGVVFVLTCIVLLATALKYMPM